MIKAELDSAFLDIFDERIPYLCELLEIEGVYLAGGLLRTIINPVENLDPDKTDVDLFFLDGGVLAEVQKFIETYTEYHKVYQCSEGKLASYVYLNGEEEKWKLQLVSVDFYPDMESLLDSFDFTVTMYATDGIDFVCGDTAIQDTLDMHLVWNKITYPASSLRRMIKYSKKGFWMWAADYQEFVAKVWEHNISISDATLVYLD